MITRLFSAALRGVDALEVEVEVKARNADKPVVIIVGSPDAAIRESSQRVISDIGASGLCLDDGIKTENLALADLKKEGPSFDLPIALAMIAASGTKPFDAKDHCALVTLLTPVARSLATSTYGHDYQFVIGGMDFRPRE